MIASSEDATIAAYVACRVCAWRAAVMSRAILAMPTTRPSASLIGEIDTETSIRPPSLRTRWVS